MGRNSQFTQQQEVAGGRHLTESISKMVQSQKQRSEISQSVILNQEQREVVNDMIDKLDLQKTLRQKAKVFFDKG